MSEKFRFSAVEDEKLVELVANQPALFDASHPDYKDQMIKENIWKEISQKVLRTGDDCKKRWRNIRDTYMKQRKIEPTGSAAKSKSKWPLLAQLEFLNKVSYERSTKSNINIKKLEKTSDEDDDSLEETEKEDNNSSESKIISTPDKNLEEISLGNESKRRRLFTTKDISKKRNDNNEKILNILQKRSTEREQIMRNIFEKKSVEPEDATLHFFKSMAMTVKTFPPELIVEAKSKIHNIVSELEIRSITKTQQSEEHFSSNLPISRPGTSHSGASSDVANYYTNYYPSDDSRSTDFDFTCL